MKTAILNIIIMLKNIKDSVKLLPKWINNKVLFFNKFKKEFGLSIAFAVCLKGLNPQKYMMMLEKYFAEFLKDNIKKYCQNTSTDIYKNTSSQKTINNKPTYVWTCWLTGYDDMPPVVKLCYNSMKKMIPSDKAELILITLENYKDYVTIPEYIVEKYQKGIIGPAHFSDVIRFCLLSEWGGMWLDSTIYISSPVPEEYLNAFFFSQKTSDPSKYPLEPSKAQWSSFLWSGPKNNLFFSFVRDGLFRYWKEHNIVVDYVFFDYIMLTGYTHVPAFFEMINNNEPNNEDIWKLTHLMNDEFNCEEYEKICKKTIFHKLTYKIELNEFTSDKKLSYYGYLREVNK